MIECIFIAAVDNDDQNLELLNNSPSSDNIDYNLVTQINQVSDENEISDNLPPCSIINQIDNINLIVDDDTASLPQGNGTFVFLSVYLKNNVFIADLIFQLVPGPKRILEQINNLASSETASGKPVEVFNDDATVL